MKNKLKKFIKSKVFFFILGFLLASTLTVGAVNLIYSKDVTYDNTSSGLKSTTVQGALDELFEKAKSAPSCDSDGNCTVSCPSGQVFLATSNGYKCVKNAGKTLVKSVGTVTSGDGLYKDSVTEGRYYYRGSNPNNYITFNNETWRIISIESDGTLKVIGPSIGTITWDDASSCSEVSYNNSKVKKRYNGNKKEYTYEIGNLNYLVPDYVEDVGCNKWDRPAYINTYLNKTYYNKLSDSSNKMIVKGTFNIGSPGNEDDTESLETDAAQEKQYQWEGKVGLITATELLRASTNSSCTSMYSGSIGTNNGKCGNNWLASIGDGWTLSSTSNNYSVRGTVLANWYGGRIWRFAASSSVPASPVLHLSSTITLKGTGSSSDPYTIVS